MTGPLDFAAAKAVLLSSVISQSIKLARDGREWKACCPFHQEKTASFTVNDDKGFYHCFGCGAHGDVVDFVAAIAGCGLGEALQRLCVGDLPKVVPVVQITETVDAARRIWRSAGPVEGTVADQYLRGRGIIAAIPPTFRFSTLRHPEGGYHSCLVALITGPDGKFAGIQRTFLNAQGGKAFGKASKLSLGRVRGGAIRLAAVAPEIVVCEGAEDGLSLAQELQLTVWVAAGASMLPGMQFPALIRSIVIAADNDEAGRREPRRGRAR